MSKWSQICLNFWPYISAHSGGQKRENYVCFMCYLMTNKSKQKYGRLKCLCALHQSWYNMSKSNWLSSVFSGLQTAQLLATYSPNSVPMCKHCFEWQEMLISQLLVITPVSSISSISGNITILAAWLLSRTVPLYFTFILAYGMAHLFWHSVERDRRSSQARSANYSGVLRKYCNTNSHI